MLPFILWIPSLLFLIDFAQNKREPFWAYILICLGPMGSLAYLLYHYESITFPFPLARTLRSLGQGPVSKTCPRCLKVVNSLESVVDGRQTHHMCSDCAAELARI